MRLFYRLLLALSLLSGTCVAQVNWVKPLQLPEQLVPSQVYSVKSYAQGHYALGVASLSVSPSLFAVSRLDIGGNTLWTYTPNELTRDDGAAPGNGALDLVIDTDNAAVIAFSCRQPDGLLSHCVVKLAQADGHELWRRVIPFRGGGSNYESGVRLALAATGGFYVESSSRQVTRLDATGTFVWNRDLDIGYAFTGTALANGDWAYASNTALVRFAGGDGSTRWTYSIADQNFIASATLLPLPDNTLVLSMRSNGAVPTQSVRYDRLIKLSALGQVDWINEQTTADYEQANTVTRKLVGAYVIRTYYRPGVVMTISATDLAGALVWERSITGYAPFSLGGQVFLRHYTTPTLYERVDPATGNSQPAVQFATTIPPYATLPSDQYVLFTNSGSYPIAEIAIEAFAVNGTASWSGRVFRADPIAARLSTDEYSGTCRRPSMSTAANGNHTVFARFSTVPKAAQPQQEPNGTASVYRLRYSPTGDLLESQSLGPQNCPPAEFSDGSSLIHSYNFGARKIRPDGSVAWSTPLSSTGGYGTTFVMGNGTAVVQVNGTTATLDGNGVVLTQTYLQSAQGIGAAMMDAVPFGNDAMLAVDAYARVFRTDGQTVAWFTPLASAGCEARTVRLLAHQQQSIVVLQNDCDGSKIARVDSSGIVLWQKLLATGRLATDTKATAAVVDASGRIFVAGCTANTSGAGAARSLVQAFNPDGSSAWVFMRDVAPTVSECASSIATTGDGRVYVAVKSDRPAYNQHLVQLTPAGAFEGISTRLLEQPDAEVEHMVATPGNRLVVLGWKPFVANTSPAYLPGTIRELQPASFARPWKLAFAAAPQTAYRYGDLMTLTVGLFHEDASPYPATESVRVRVLRESGAGSWVGATECTIPPNGTSCTVQGRWSKVESSIVLRAESDGAFNAYSATYTLLAANTVMTATLVAPTNTAWDVVSVDVTIQAPPPVLPLGGAPGYLRIINTFSTSCAAVVVSGPLPVTLRCTVALQGGDSFTDLYFDANTPEYTSTFTRLSFTGVERAQPTLLVERETTAPTRIGDRTRLFVKIMVGARDVTQYYSSGLLYVGCAPQQPCAMGTWSTFAGVQRTYIDIPANTIGPATATVQFDGNRELLPASSSPVPYEVVAGAGVRGNLQLPSYTNPRFCATAPGVTCQIATDGQFFCDVPLGWTGEIYPQGDVTATTGYSFANAPIRFVDAQRVQSFLLFVTTGVNIYNNFCVADIDGDGVVGAFTDGVIILRAMLGLTGETMAASATHACAPLSAAARETRLQTLLHPSPNSPSLPAPGDIDANGQVDAATDGVLLLRALLGFRGTALTNGALGAGAARQNAEQIRQYVLGCGARQLY